MHKKELEKRLNDKMQSIVDYCNTFNEIDYSVNEFDELLIVAKSYDDNEKLIKFSAIILELLDCLSYTFYQVDYLLLCEIQEPDNRCDHSEEWDPVDKAFKEFNTVYKRPIVDNHIACDGEI